MNRLMISQFVTEDFLHWTETMLSRDNIIFENRSKLRIILIFG